MSDPTWTLPESSDIVVRETATAGRGVYAHKALSAGTRIFTTSPALSPTAYAILRAYRREVCAFCFAYDRGREWKIRPVKTSLAFCSQDCNDRWVAQYGDLALQAHEAVEASIQQQLRRKEDVEMQAKFYSHNDAHAEWEEAAKVGRLLQEARRSQKPSKAQKQLLRQHCEARVEPDILSFLLSTALVGSSDATPALMNLADNPAVYEASSLDDHIRAFHLLLATVPIELLDSVRAHLCHEYVSRASHNAFSIRPTADGDYSGEFLGYGVWPEASFFNHSCSPNVKKMREERQWSFWTSRDVLEGDELCITYLGGEEKELDMSQRRERLKTEWGFVCGCQKCAEESKT